MFLGALTAIVEKSVSGVKDPMVRLLFISFS